MILTLRGTGIIIYIDDILIPVNSIEEGFKHLEKVLEILKSNNLTINI